jgi:ATP-dependent DNA helicase RecG
VLEDLKKYHGSTIKEIHNRIGTEIPVRKLRTCLYNAVQSNEIRAEGSKKYRKYFIDKNME